MTDDTDRAPALTYHRYPDESIQHACDLVDWLADENLFALIDFESLTADQVIALRAFVQDTLR